MRRGFMARLSKEDQPDLPSHVEGREEGRNTQKQINERVTQACIQQNLILRPEAGKRDNARQSQCSDQIEPVRGGHGLAHATHIAHVVRVKRFDCASAIASAPLRASFAVRLSLCLTMSFFFLTCTCVRCTCLAFLAFPMMHMLYVMMSTFHAQDDRTGREE